VCLVSNMVFHRGYPLAREMLPFYPVIVFALSDALKYIKPSAVAKTALAVLGVLLCFQFIKQIDITGTKDWRTSYEIRGNVLSDFGSERKTLLRNPDWVIDEYGIVGRFYVEKLKVNGADL